MRVAGVDGFRGGWVAVVLDDLAFRAVAPFRTLAELLEALADVSVVAVDIPIGVGDDSPRPADVAARRFLRGRASAVFATPPRAALSFGTYAEARVSHPSLSAQSFALARKIREADAAAAGDERVYEVHPEVSFHELAGGRSLPPKKTWAGHTVRRAALAAVGIRLPDDLGEAGRVPPDDVLDAAAGAWSAGRIARGAAATLPAELRERIGPIWY